MPRFPHQRHLYAKTVLEFCKNKLYSSFLLAQRNNSPLFDEEELQSEAVQRAWQYLQLYNSDPRLIQHFNFDAQQKRDDSPEECLETLIRFVSFNFTCSLKRLPCFALLGLERRKHSKG